MLNPNSAETGMVTIYEAFRHQVLTRPDAEAVVFPDNRFTYAKLDRIAKAFAHKLQKDDGVGDGSLLMLQSDELVTVLGFFLAASRLGAAIVERNDKLVVPSGHRLTHHFYTGEAKSDYPSYSKRIDQDWSPARVSADTEKDASVVPDTSFFFTFSGGTTGLPKVIPLSHDMVLKRSLAASFDFKSGETRFATLLPIGSRPFMARALGALANGATVINGIDCNFWLAEGVNLVSSTRNQMLAYLKKHPLPQKINEAEIMGSRLTSRYAALLLQSFDQVQDVIGAAEASKFYVNRHSMGAGNVQLVTGQMLDSDVEVIDVVSGSPTLTEEGALRVRNPYLARSYAGDEQAAKQFFKNGWFYTGDSARWGANNTLEISERHKNILNFGGVKIHAALIDRVLRSTRGIRDGISFKNPKAGAKDEVFAFVVFEEGANQIQATEVAKLNIEEALGSTFVPRVIRDVGGLPRLEDGTADREACANLILRLAAAKDSPST